MIHRINKKNCFTQIPNSTLQDTTISPQARSLLLFTLAFPNDCFFSEKQLAGDFNVSERTIARWKMELIEAGYLKMKKSFSNGKYITEYHIFDAPTIVAERKNDIQEVE
jgi:hypothetical protein